MMEPLRKQHWAADDYELEAEFQDLLGPLREHERSALIEEKVPAILDRRIRRLAAERTVNSLETNWLLGPGPLVILVVFILFGVALFVMSL